MISEALEEVGLPADLAAYAGKDTFDVQLRASHAEGISQVGEDVGTPIVSVNGVAFFGPVVTPAPKGDAAGRLWDGAVLVAGTPGSSAPAPRSRSSTDPRRRAAGAATVTRPGSFHAYRL